MIAALTWAAGRCSTWISKRKRRQEFWPSSRCSAAAGPAASYLVIDNFSPHKHPKVTSGAWTFHLPVAKACEGAQLTFRCARWRCADEVNDVQVLPPYFTVGDCKVICTC
jgi:hypothetical protein